MYLSDAGHNDIELFPEYLTRLRRFLNEIGGSAVSPKAVVFSLPKAWAASPH